jgi:hypothetical protein
VPIILFCVVLSQISVCDVISKSNSIWSKIDHESTITTDISSIRCSLYGHLMNSVKLIFKFLYMKSKYIKFHLSFYIKILVLNTTSSLLADNFSIPAIRVYLRHFSLISFFISGNGCETHLLDKIITRMTAQETSLSPRSLESHPLKWRGDNMVFILCSPCLSSLVGLMDWFRSLTTTSPDWWLFSLSLYISFLCLYDLWSSLQYYLLEYAYSPLEIFQR